MYTSLIYMCIYIKYFFHIYIYTHELKIQHMKILTDNAIEFSKPSRLPQVLSSKMFRFPLVIPSSDCLSTSLL